MMKKRIFAAAALVFCAGLCFSKPSATLERLSDRFFWQISGKDANGNDAVVYIQGTIHVGSEELYPLGDAVTAAFNAADRHVSEVSSEDVANLLPEIQGRMFSSFQKAGGRRLSEHLTEDELETAASFSAMLGAPFGTFDILEPWVTNAALTSALVAACGYEVEYGLDAWFYAKLSAMGKGWEGLDTLEAQLGIVTFGDYDEQLVILKSTLAELSDIEKASAELTALFDAYRDNDTDAVTRIMGEETGKGLASSKTLQKKYRAALITDRNKAWAKKIAGYLSQGGTTFVFAGCAHFLGDDSVFTYLKKNKTIQ